MKLPKEEINNIILNEIKEDSKVLDLGCGDGTLLKFLIDNKNVVGHGIDFNTEEIIKCIEKGISVIHWNLDNLPLDFPDSSYDMVILTQTLQQVYHPEKLILEILRVGKEAILSFPNFGSKSIRWQFLMKGKMPITSDLPNKWYNTPNIKLLTIKDFIDFCNENDIDIITQAYFKSDKGQHTKIKFLPNIMADIAVFKIRKNK
ncbi:MAG: methionine biosynthesis protein MetW [Spirochaetes bacterium GWF1_31_7]|nr:MAG: methionine biosynthesis protein MetW [Spirochaetes bacterium GWE1_32_154]OHD48343.1 MAG: methionine biosynthesis protein MetW [Spirochaetes bacterium GWF1_31_7]OHD51622.1 MAG: methionine biosynthesis protein MetW [Spirochaetes bacterium GWE2_31_10]HBD96345.1 methionine biosynthesis protein MetW [Spirochaetia bacterium]HBI38325.1 methionine biosynthesis protein MetW [Spirochaetia bacterium]